MIWGSYKGATKGLISGIFSIMTVVVPPLGSMKLLNTTVRLLGKWQHNQRGMLPYVVFAALFVGILIAITWLESYLKNWLKPTLIGKLDRLLGGILGIVRWGMYSSVFLWVGKAAHLQIPAMYTEGTVLFPIVQALYPKCLTWSAAWFPYAQEWLTAVVR